MHGRAPEFLFSYKNLRYLDLSHTTFSGKLPPQFANSSKLEHLDLSSTFLSGTILPQLGNVSNLRHLGLGFTQDIHTSDISWLNRLQFLEYIDMSGIDLSTADAFLVANKIPSLKALLLINCSLPNANLTLLHLNLTKLEQLHLARNYLGHPIETCWFWNISSIKDLGLGETYLYGPFPGALGGMTSLQRLDFSNNGNSATMAVDLKNLCDLEELSLKGSLAFGNITKFVRKLPQCSSIKLFFLSLRDNNMTGILPDMMGHLNGLRYLYHSNNSITGAIPSGLRNLTSLERIDLCLNQLTGQIPMLPRSLIGVGISMNCLSGPLPLDFGAPNLTELSLSSNHLTGHVPRAICQLQNLVTLDLSSNLLEGEFPSCSTMPNMEFLILSNNNFSGNFPSWLQNSSSLIFLDLAVNKFYGMLPTWIGELVNLRFLQLNHNMFYGDIPVSITNLILLQHFSLASNNISGSIPSPLSKLIAMTLEHPPRLGSDKYVHGDSNKDILSVVMKQQELKYGTSAVNEMVGIDLSLNHLTGGIPDEITSLNGLLNLNLSRNHLGGKIPMKIGDMKSLESLDFSRNNLSGEIPTSLSNLTYLGSLDLSYDHLAGKIPTGRQLDTLYTENPCMYSGNIGLCGPPLEKNCPGNNAPKHGNQQQGSGNGYDPVLFFYFGLAAGFVAGLWVVLCVLLFKRSWRIAYLRLYDKLYDIVYVFVVVTWGQDNQLTGALNQVRPI
jgi:Leucine-rich repeat (LRR) protein